MAGGPLRPGLHEALLTRRLEEFVTSVGFELLPEVADLRNAEASDRVSRHLATVIARAIDGVPEDERARRGGANRDRRTSRARSDHRQEAGLRGETSRSTRDASWSQSLSVFRTADRGRSSGRSRRCSTRPSSPTRRASRRSGTSCAPRSRRRTRSTSSWRSSAGAACDRSLDALRRHCEAGKPLRVLTTTYTNSTEQRALDELARLGAEIKVSYDTSSTRLHAKAWIFHRESGYSTAYIGSSNLTHSAQVLGLEWNVRVSGSSESGRRREDGGGLRELLGEPRLRRLRRRRSSRERTRGAARATISLLSPIEIELRPFQEALLEHVVLARHQGHHRNLLVAATGTGKTVMAAVDYARLRAELGREPAPLRRAPRGDPRPESRDVPARAARRRVRREVGRRAAADRASSTCSPRSRACNAADVSSTSTRRTSTS